MENEHHFSYELREFVLDRVLNEDSQTHSIALLGSLPHKDSDERKPAIVRVERLGISSSFAPTFPVQVDDVRPIENTDIYSWMLAWTKRLEDNPDIKINVIFPATEVHIRKYSKQNMEIFRETPALYESIVKPFIDSFPPARTQWVENILSGVSEASKVLFNDPDPEHGFVVLPDMKWDCINVSNLYLVAIARSPRIRSLRDLEKKHLPLLRRIKEESQKATQERWKIRSSGLRFYIHYQPSYYRFHVHVVNVNYTGLAGMSVGHAHLLEDIISLLELSSEDGPSLLQQMTLTYSLGEQHGLYNSMKGS